MDKALWRKIASSWVSFRSAAENEKTAYAAEMLFQQAVHSRQETPPLTDLLMRSINEENDDDGY